MAFSWGIRPVYLWNWDCNEDLSSPESTYSDLGNASFEGNWETEMLITMVIKIILQFPEFCYKHLTESTMKTTEVSLFK